MSKALILTVLATVVRTFGISFAQGAGVEAVAPIDGYACLQLARDAPHLMDASSSPPMLAAPSPDASSLGLAPYLVIARTPQRVVNGYVETLWLGSTRGRPVIGWVSAGALLPFHSAAVPTARCVPVWLSNGHPGALTQ